MPQARVGYRLYGTVYLNVKDMSLDEVEKALLELPTSELFQNLEGMPFDIAGDAIEVVCIEHSSDEDGETIMFYDKDDIEEASSLQRPFSVIEGEQKKLGAIYRKRMDIKCNVCENTDKFYGTARVHPFIVIEKVAPSKYDVTQIGYRNNGDVDEKVEKCAVCGSHDLDITIKVEFERESK